MDQAQFLTILQSVLMLTLKLSTPILMVSMVVGLVVSIFQSVTQIQESTITFVPKIIAGILALIILMPWMMNTFIYQTHEWFEQMLLFIK